VHKWLRFLVGVAVVAVGGVTAGAGAVVDSPAATTVRGTVGMGGALPNGDSIYAPALSNDGRYVTFTSRASNLVAGDTNGFEDAFVYDRLSKTTERVSVASDGAQGIGASVFPVISTDGRYVAFFSNASNLVPGTEANSADAPDVYLRDRVTNTTILVSRDSQGKTGNGSSVDAQLSLDGRYLAYFSNSTNIVDGDTDGLFDIYVYDISTGLTARVRAGSEIPLISLVIDPDKNSNSDDEHPVISADGRFVAFQSSANNLVAPSSPAGKRPPVCSVYMQLRDGKFVRVQPLKEPYDCNNSVFHRL